MITPTVGSTVLLEMLDEVEIALVPLDVGQWVLHCHIQEHGLTPDRSPQKIA